ncbi:CpaF family protein [Candidatus Formimonas warabiya]|uniref:Type II secretion system protein E n=1 Tax=Formimonas warabiya TaxID=1761012 RepID=A0A3G1KU93_FORW1|nr:CpaF family protein [Candidatus Formimonas warabiya]ATW26021.1 type II secretion system protein E [Candidatus Formimonas warabiya]
MSLLQRLEKRNAPQETVMEQEKNYAKEEFKDKYGELKIKVHKEVIEILDKELKQNRGFSDNEIAKKVEEVINTILEREASFLPYSERQKISSEILDEVLGLGPIESLIRDSDVSEVMVNGPHQVFMEKKGKILLSEIRFRDDEHVMHVIEKIVAPIGRRIDESMPMVDARLPDGSRVNAIIPPLSLKGPVVTIRKFSRDPLKISDLIRFGSLIPSMAKFLEACVRSRLNIVISGGTGSGKTTTLNVLSAFIPHDERIVTIEDAAEIQLRQNHVITLETRAPNIEGKGAVTMRDLVRNSLRMRPDRIVVGEVRAGEALDMLQAMNTGHDGSLTTGHANSPRDILSRLETMVLMAGMDLPIRAIREQIASAVDIIVQQNRLRDGSRKITHVTEVLGMEGDTIVLQDIFTYEQTGIDPSGNIIGAHRATGIMPKCVDKFEAEGIFLPQDIFMK